MDGNNNARGYSYRDLTRRMEEGSRFFTQGYFADAATCFRHARDFSIQIHGESSLECAITRYSRGLSLLCQIPVPINDPMAFVQKEVDYYTGSALPFPSSAFAAYGGLYVLVHDKRGPGRESRNNSRGRKGRTKYCMVDHGISNRQLLIESKHTVCPGGGRIQNRGIKSSALLFRSIFHFRYLARRKQQASSRYVSIAEFRYVKLLICLEGSDKSKAIEFGYKAMFIYRALYEKLPSETGTADQRRGSSSVTRTDPFIQQNRDEAQQLCNMITNLAHKASSYETHSLFALFTREVS
ncbi:hypothetical protein OIU74_013563 [Salix koriyanagi]|uniref:Uncharacterized protein n=1 Tax=Salix koriyanagi TaxID=2511006 RepID=A0A9Q0Q9C4_9ROSI|nr:hypothetical protein OIU74_013563 [Salix koriyanagi]